MAKKDTAVKDTIPDGGNSTMSLLASIERIESIEQEKKALAEQQKEEKAAIKGMGFSMKAVNRLLQLRRMDPAARAELEAEVDLYETALDTAKANRLAADEAAAAKKGGF